MESSSRLPKLDGSSSKRSSLPTLNTGYLDFHFSVFSQLLENRMQVFVPAPMTESLTWTRGQGHGHVIHAVLAVLKSLVKLGDTVFSFWTHPTNYVAGSV